MKPIFIKPTNFIVRLSSLIVVIMTIVLALPGTNFSQWIELPVSISANNQTNAVMVTDGSGGSIITWQDERNGKSEIYAQRMNSIGNAIWTPNGIAICTLDSSFNPVIASDGSGGAIIAWESYRGTSITSDIYAQRVNSNGVVKWTTNGVPVCTEVYNQNAISMVSDGSNGAILTWQDYRSVNGNSQIYAQRIDSIGATIWGGTNGVGVFVHDTKTALGPKLINDGSGGAFITWYDNFAVDYDIRTQRLAGTDGAPMYTANGVATCTFPLTDQIKPDICSDGAGGVIITWQDYRNGLSNCDIFAQRMSSTLEVGIGTWPTNGLWLNGADAANDQIDPKIVSDNSGGAIISWTDYKLGATSGIYAQHVSYSGALVPGWGAPGVIICTAAGDQIKSQIASDGNGGAYIVWEDYRSGNSDIYMQHIDYNAAKTWSDNGFAICTAVNNQLNPMIVSDGNHGAIVVWQDFRSGNNFDIYESGTNSTLPVELSSFTFIISGQNINLRWATVSEQNNLGFDIERKIMTGNWVKIGFIKGQGTVNTPSNYTFEDRNLQTGKYYYRLKQTDYNGNFEYFNLSGFAEVGIPLKYNLSQNYPNPFNPDTRINFEIPKDSKVNITVFDLVGRVIKTIVNEVKTAGYYTIQFDASGISSGTYFYRILTEGNNKFTMTKKLVVLK